MNHIINPLNNKKVNLFSSEGKLILKNFIKQYFGGSKTKSSKTKSSKTKSSKTECISCETGTDKYHTCECNEEKQLIKKLLKQNDNPKDYSNNSEYCRSCEFELDEECSENCLSRFERQLINNLPK